MKTSRITFLLFLLIILLPGLAEASGPRVEVTILDSTKRDRDRDKRATSLTQQEDQTVSFSAILTNREFDEVEDLKLRVFIFSKDPLQKRAPYQFVKVFEPEPFNLAYNEKKEIELGKASFSHTEHREAKYDPRLSDISHIAVQVTGKGSIYGGWGAELYHEGSLVKTFGSNSESRKAMREMPEAEKKK